MLSSPFQPFCPAHRRAAPPPHRYGIGRIHKGSLLQLLFLATGAGMVMACQPGSANAALTLTSIAPNRTLEAQLGKALFEDTSLSEPAGQACQTCHDPAAGYATPPAQMDHGVSRGVVAGLFGARNAPTAAYAAFSPSPYFDPEASTWVGGQFLDQRADTLEAQARGPFLNPLEMANSSPAMVVEKVRGRPYAASFRAIYGPDALDNTDEAYDRISRAIAAYERTEEFSPFSSKYDAFLRNRASLSSAELRGFAIFKDERKGNCSACHPHDGDHPLFTDFTSDNIGVPKNPENPFYTQAPSVNPDGAGFVDLGLGATPRVNRWTYYGRFKVPTLRNVAVTAPYMHNGVFTTLEQVIRFYNTACVSGNPDGWDPPEYAATRNCEEMGNLGLTDQEIGDLVAFLRTLTDGYLPE